MNRQLVNSSNIRSIGYDAKTSILEIEFKDDSVYQYFGVPQELYVGLISASSHGKYLNQYIKNIFNFSKIY